MPALVAFIEKQLEGRSLGDLQQASLDVTERYRKRTGSLVFRNNIERLAYLGARFPATLAAMKAVLGTAALDAPTSHLDLGAGPGTAFWAARAICPQITQTTLIERDSDMIALGQGLMHESGIEMETVTWVRADLRNQELLPHDLVTFSYCLNEMTPAEMQGVLAQAWAACAHTLVICEPGTPEGFAAVKAARAYLIELGAHLVAPCTHEAGCPMSPKDWCHFKVSLERTALHRLIKQSELTREDEKYSYLVASKTPQPRPGTRIVKHPLQRPGHVILDLCGPDGLKRRIVSKKETDFYKLARKSSWGDGFSE